MTVIVRRPGADRRGVRGGSGDTGYNPATDPAVEAYWRPDMGTTVSGSNILTIADQSPNAHDLSYTTGTHFQLVSGGSSPHFKRDTMFMNEDGVSPGKYTWANGPIDVGAGEYLNIYVIGRMRSHQADAEGATKHILQDNSSSEGWIVRTQKAALGDKMYEYVYDGAGIVRTDTTDVADAVWAPGVAQVLRYGYDGDGTSHTMRAERGASQKTWSATGHAERLAAGYVGHATLGASGEIACILVLKSTTPISDGKHNQIMGWAEREFLKPFDPLTQIDGATVEAFWRMDQGVTVDGSNNILAVVDQSGNGFDLAPNGTRYWVLDENHPQFKTPVAQSVLTAGVESDFRIPIAAGDFEAPAGGRLVMYYVWLQETPSGEVNGKTRIIAQNFASGSGWLSRTQYLTASGARGIQYSYDGAGASKSDISPNGALDTGGPVIYRGDVDDTGAEILCQIDDTDNTPSAATGHTASAASFFHIGSPNASVPAGRLAAALALKVTDRVPQGVHRKITQWLREEFIV